MPTTQTKALVLSKESFGEADCYIQFLTEDFGLISALAKSAKKSKRRYIGGLDVFCHDVIFLTGDPRERPYLTELTVLNSFQLLRSSLEKLMAAGEATRWIKALGNTALAQPYLYKLFGQTLAMIEKEETLNRLETLLFIFKSKLLAIVGLKPNLSDCTRCNAPVLEDALLDIASGGILCSQCGLKIEGNYFYRLSRSERDLLNQVTDRKWNELAKLFIDEKTGVKLSLILRHFAEFHGHIRLTTSTKIT